jgi:ABC-type transport system substrate-binding protein
MKRGLHLTAAVSVMLCVGLAAAAVPAQSTDKPAAQKVLRYAFRVAETGFDPAQINDLYSRTVTPHIFEGLYHYDHLARPAKIKPLTADGMPAVSDDFKTWTVRIKPGIFFADDPAFKGRPRELVAEDYVYAFKRFADPANKSPLWTFVEQYGLLGLAEQRQHSLDRKAPFDYDRRIDGLRALDRYTIQFRMAEPRPRFIDPLATGDLFGAVAREVVEAYGDAVPAHPVGTGPFLLKQWRRSSLIVLERNPTYREVRYDAEPAADDVEGQALLARLKGRRLPMVDRVEVSIIEEEQPRWLSFLNGQHEMIEQVPPEFIVTAMPKGKVAPNLAKKGVQGYRIVRPDITIVLYNMDDPVIGGLAPEKVALRRALNLAYDVDREIRLVWRNQAIPAQSPLMPHTSGYDPKFKSENGDYSPARAKALLDLYGYVDRDGDGWREMPDGSPLTLQMATQPDGLSRQRDELRKQNLDAIGVRLAYRPAKWPENLKAARAGKVMVWALGYSAAGADGQNSLQRYHSKQVGGQNMARFRLPAFDAIYDRMGSMADGAERLALFDEAKKLAIAYAPYKTMVHRIVNDMAQPTLIGYRRPLFWQDWWQYVDIDTERMTKK